MIPSHIQDLLSALHKESLVQEGKMSFDEVRKWYNKHGQPEYMAKIDAFYLDKFIALDQDKALFVYNLLLAKGATTVVEAGTSFGVSTIYLSLAVSENVKRSGKLGKVIATEKEATKAAKARKIWQQCGDAVTQSIDLREGDLNQTLADDLGLAKDQYVDVLLLDIWPYVALPALKLVKDKMKPGSIVLIDNSISSAEGYKELLEVLRNPAGPWTSVTLPYKGGFEMAVLGS